MADAVLRLILEAQNKNAGEVEALKEELQGATDATAEFTDADDELIRSLGEVEEAAQDVGDEVEDLGEKGEKAGKKGKSAMDKWAQDQGVKQKFEILGKVIDGVGKAFDLADKEAQKLGRTDVSDNIAQMREEFGGLMDTLVQFPVSLTDISPPLNMAVKGLQAFGVNTDSITKKRDFLQWMGDAAEGATNFMNVAQALALKLEVWSGAITQEEAAERAAALAAVELTAAQIAEIDATMAAASATEDARVQYDNISLAKARDEQAARDLATAQSDLATILAGPVGAELDAYYQRQKDAGAAIADTKLKIEDLNTKKYLTPAQKEELEALNQTLKDQQAVYDENATAHELATARIVFGFVQQQMAADGLSADEIVALADIGQAWGIYDQKTADTLKAVTESVAKHGADSKAILDDLDGRITDLPDHKDFTYNIHVNGQVPIGAEPGGGAPVNYGPPDNGNTTYGGAQAEGGDYWVTKPTWFFVEGRTPERATFTPQGKSGGGGDVNISIDARGSTMTEAQMRTVVMRALSEMAQRGDARMRLGAG